MIRLGRTKGVVGSATSCGLWKRGGSAFKCAGEVILVVRGIDDTEGVAAGGL